MPSILRKEWKDWGGSPLLMPIGVPMPSFGIAETAPALPSPWTSDISPYYYIDEATGTDVGRTFGNPTAPRLTIPNSLSAGAVVILVGTYTKAHTSPNDFKLTGTVGSPIYIRGTNTSVRPTITNQWEVGGNSSYFILEYLKFVPTAEVRPILNIFSASTGATHHGALRHSEVQGNDVGAIGAGEAALQSNSVSNAVSDFVFWDCYIHDGGDPAATGDPDVHGISVSNSSAGNAGVNNVWILDCHLARNQGDGVQITNAILADQSKLHHIYIGRCLSHDNRQSGMFSKSAVDVVFSQNETYGHRVSASAPGAGLGGQYGVDRLWVIFNRIHDNDLGINFGSASGLGADIEIHIVGNVIYDNGPTSPTYDPNDVFQQKGAFHSLPVAATRYVVNNTMWGNTRGASNTDSSTGLMHFINNIIGAPTYANDRTIFNTNLTSAGRTVNAGSDMKNNIVVSTEQLSWGQQAVESLATFQTNTGKGQNSTTTAPTFVNVAAKNFRLASGSAGIDAGLAGAYPYAQFLALYGLSIAVDIDGIARPQSGVWDIGAYER